MAASSSDHESSDESDKKKSFLTKKYSRSDQNDPKATDWKKWREEKKKQHKEWKEQRLLKKLKKKQKQQETIVAEQEASVQTERYTVSLALPGSILDNAQSPELRTYLAGQIARAATIFSVQEIIIFDEYGRTTKDSKVDGHFKGVGKRGQANIQMVRLLQFLECPQYLRKYLFPVHKDLQYAGLLNPLDASHHLREPDISTYREGVVVDRPVREGKGSFVNVGLKKDAQIDELLQPGVRVTVKFNQENTDFKRLRGKCVSPFTPWNESAIYWGYTVRLASSLGAVFTHCPYEDGYDLTIGTSDKGNSVDQFKVPNFRHALIVFGGLKGLEASVEADESLEEAEPQQLFQYYINVCPNQGSRTIRTEEAILITMSALRPKIVRKQASS